MLALYSRVVFPSHSGPLSMLAATAAPKMTVEERTSRRRVFEMAVKTISALTGVGRANASPRATVVGSMPLPQRRHDERPSDPRLRRHLPRPRRNSAERDLTREAAVNPVEVAASTRIQRPLADLCSASRAYLQPREVAPMEAMIPRTKSTQEIPLFNLETLSLKGRLITPVTLYFQLIRSLFYCRCCSIY